MQALKINKLDIAALISGLVFGVGLLLSGMANPKKSTGFPRYLWRLGPHLSFSDDWCDLGYSAGLLAVPRQDNLALRRAYPVAQSDSHRPKAGHRWSGFWGWLGTGRVLSWPCYRRGCGTDSGCYGLCCGDGTGRAASPHRSWVIR